MKKFIAVLFVCSIAWAQVPPSFQFNSHNAYEFKVNSGWTVKSAGGLGQTYVQLRFSGLLTTDSLFFTWNGRDSVAGKRLSFGGSDSITWLSLPTFSTSDSLRFRSKTDDSIWVRLRIYK